MPVEFRLPDLGEGVTEGEIVKVHVAEGQRIEEDQPLMVVETDKASVEIPSPHTGTVVRVHVADGQTVNVGTVMVTFDVAGAVASKTSNADTRRATARGTTARTTAPATARGHGSIKPASPAVRKLARSLGVDLTGVDGSGPGGRVTRADVDRAAGGGSSDTAGGSPAPATRRPSGPSEDTTWGPIRREPVSRARRTIAETMIRSVSKIPHVTDCDDADVTDLDKLRRGYDQRKLTLLPFVIRACALALSEHPVFNAAFDADAGEIVHHDYISISIGVHTDRGLIAPVIRNVDSMSLAAIADALVTLSEKARSASFAVNDTRGGTFTISNAGAMGGSRYSTPIINEPQAAILALGRTRLQPWVVDGEVTPRSVLPLSLSFDHRMIDGAQEVAFMQSIIQRLQNPARLLIDPVT